MTEEKNKHVYSAKDVYTNDKKVTYAPDFLLE